MSLFSAVRPSSETLLFLTRSLDRGGAERQLVALAKGLARRGHAVAVAVFFGGGVYEAELAGAGVRVIDIGKQGRWDILLFLGRLLRHMRKERPALVHSYLGVPNVVAVVLKPMLPYTRLVWGIRASDMDLSQYDWLVRLAYGLECRLACFADRIIANSHAGKRHAVANGFPEAKIVVIPNGVDTNYFQYDAGGRRRLRSAWGIDDNEILIGLIGRLDPMKDHRTFIEAASNVTPECRNARFVCVGDGAVDYAETLRRHAVTRGLTSRLIWVEAQDDMPAVYSALDVAASSSCSEGFSNTIAEAMSCGTPVVVTDVGDSACIVGKTGLVVPRSDPDSLAQALLKMLALASEQRSSLGRQARSRIVAKFSIENLLVATERELLAILRRPARKHGYRSY